MIRALTLGALLLAFAGTAPAGEAADSLYGLKASLVNQVGQTVPFDVYRGQPVLISMFYESCDYVCPMLIANIGQLENQLDQAARSRLRVLLISIDPEHDTPEVLAGLARKHRADLGRWTFARADARDVRKISALLGIQYRALPEGGFNHSVLMTLLDRDGSVLARSAKLQGAAPEFTKALRAATAAPAHGD